jgi:Leucine-rich repeat (LRR) protein
MAIGIPNDARFDELWGLHNTADTDIDAVEAWDTFSGSHDVIVAVIDTGVDYNHVDLVDNRWINEGEIADNGIDDDGNGFIDDVYGYDFAYDDNDPMDRHSHGTHCSGTIGGVGNNGIGVAGVSHTVRIMAVKFLNDSGSGYTSNAIKAVIYAVDNGAQILSNSWGGGGFSQGLEDAITYAHDHDVLFVAAAGNSSSNNDVNPHYPSSYENSNILAVASTDRNDAKASTSCYGLTSVDLGAPGVSILSSVPDNGYGFKSGTSMATPHVAGAAALLKGYNPSLSALQLKSIIMDSVDLVDSMDGITVTGGRLNLNNALMNNCLQTTEMPYTECETLVTFYNSTNGDNWTDNTDWNETNTPCSWYGVTCSGGHVSELVLSSNGLAGSIPTELSNLSNLQRLWLDNNALCGEIPVELIDLSNITNLKLDNNHLTASDSALIAWLDSHNPGWDETQTPCPPKLQFSSAVYSIKENVGQAIISVSRTDNSDGAVSVDYATSDDTATAPDDYIQTTGTLNWTDGNDADKTFTVDIVHDSELENDETVIVSLSNAGGGAELGSLNTAVLTISNSVKCAIITEIPTVECEALVAFYNSTNGDSWTDKGGWLEDNTPCSWKGVTCSGGHVSKLYLESNELTGTIPTELGNLSNLTRLSLSSNKLTGTIPTELGNLSNLTRLSLSSNQLTGTIPTELGNLSNLTRLSLSSNQLTGTIPTELGNLSQLEYLRLSFNELTGTIPTELGNLSNLTDLLLNDNELTGTIPTELGNLNKLTMLALFSNELTGTIPTELGNLSNLSSLFLYSNELTGTIPTELGNLSNLGSLWLDNNQLTGTIPTELGNLSNLRRLFLHNNQLCGEIPVELKNLSNIPLPNQYGAKLQLDNNHLTATDTQLIAWLDSHNPGWDETQTPCPQPQCKLQFSSATYSVAENGGQATITVTRTESTDGAVTIDYATTDDTATSPDDYTQKSGTLNWNDGEATDKQIQIDITDDTQKEDDETLIVSLGNPTGGAQLGTPDTATVTIKDNEGTVILSVEPPETNIYVGQEIDISIKVKAGTQQVDGASGYLDFETTYLEVVGMTAGEQLDTIIENTYDNGTGQIDYSAGKITAPFPSGDFELVTIRLKAKAETSETPLSFVFELPRKTNAGFNGTPVFSHAEDGLLHISADAQIKGSVELQGRQPKPHQSWETQIRVSLTKPTETQPRYTFNTTTNQNGEFEISPVDPTTYDIRIKGTHTLQNLKETVTLVSGENQVDFGTLLEGDANDDNCTTIMDFSQLVGTFSKCEGDTGYDAQADFNQDKCVTILDFSLLIANFKQCGAPNPSMMVSSLTTGGIIRINPSTSQVKAGEVFEVEIEVQAGEQQVNGASAYLNFDPTRLEVVKMTAGAQLNLTLDNTFDNRAGTIDFAAGKLVAPYPDGNFELVTIVLRAKADMVGLPLGFVYSQPRRTDATFGGVSIH